jgi:hypothetical protein
MLHKASRMAGLLGAGLALAAAGAMQGESMRAHAAQSDCGSVGAGFLNVELGTESSDIRKVKLSAGDRLTFMFDTGEGAFGRVVLLAGARAELPVLAGPAGTSVAFVAPRSGDFSFRLAKDGPGPARFRAACVPGETAGHGNQDKGALPLGAALPQVELDGAQGIEELTAAGIQVDATIAGRAGDQPAKAQPATTPKPPDTGLAVKMELRDQRYADAGPDGVRADPSATGANVGVNYRPQPAIMVGALAQFDPSADTLSGESRSLGEHAWMAGPVATVRLAPGLSLDASAAWGFADAGAMDLAGHAPSMPRRTVSAKLANTQTFGAWRFTPSISVNRSWDTLVAPGPSAMEAYMTSTVSAGRVDVGPELAYRLDLAPSLFIEPRAAVGGFWGLDSFAAPLAGLGHSEMRLKAEAGVTLGIADGAKLQMGGALEEGSSMVPDIWSGRVQMSIPLK